MPDPLSVIDKPEIPQIRLMSYLSRLTESQFAMGVAYEGVRQNRENIVGMMNAPIASILANPRLFKGEPSEEAKALIERELKQASDQRVENILLTLLNTSVVLACATFETCLDDVLFDLFTMKNEALLAFAADKTRTLSDILNAANYETLLKGFRRKEVATFSREEIGKKFGLIGRKVGIDQDDIFDWSAFTDEVQKNLDGMDLNALTKIFNKRHSVIHAGQRPYQNEDEVWLVYQFFEKIMMNLCIELSKKFLVPVDMLGYHAPWLNQPKA